VIDWRLLLAGIVAGILVIDGLFAWLTYPDLSPDDLDGGARSWELSQPRAIESTSVEQLLADGFWGDVSQLSSTEEQVSDEQKEAAAAKELRQKVSGIIKDGVHWQVLFKTQQGYRRFSIGEQLPGTDWVLKGVEADRLTLQQQGQKARVLKLFSDDALVLVADASLMEQEPSAEQEPSVPEAAAQESRALDGTPVITDKTNTSEQ